jgi:hypothetical protein
MQFFEGSAVLPYSMFWFTIGIVIAAHFSIQVKMIKKIL